MTSAEREFLEARKTRTGELIVKYEDAIDFLITNPTESYKLDTGQSEQEVKRHNVDNMQKALDRLTNRYTVLCKRLDTSSTISTPAW